MIINENIKVVDQKKGDSYIIFRIFMALKPLQMVETGHRCIKNVDGLNQVKNGKTKEGKQRFKCRGCARTFINNYSYNACEPTMSERIKKQLVEGSGIRSISRILNIHPVTVINRILKIASHIKRPVISKGKKYSAHAGAEVYVTGNDKTRVYKAKGMEHIGFGVGEKLAVGIEIDLTKVEAWWDSWEF
ncbi:MAG: hypothetical protein ACJATI_005543 [Halioglobus sp.]